MRDRSLIPAAEIQRFISVLEENIGKNLRVQFLGNIPVIVVAASGPRRGLGIAGVVEGGPAAAGQSGGGAVLRPGDGVFGLGQLCGDGSLVHVSLVVPAKRRSGL